MNSKILIFAAIFAFAQIGVVPAQTGATPNRQLIYQNEVKNKPTGVYEIGDDLYVNVRAKVGKATQKKRIQMKMLLSANDELKKWAINFTAAERLANKADVATGVGKAIAWLDQKYPDWRFGDWNFKANGQEFSYCEKDEYILGQVFKKADVVAAIPDSFKQSNPPVEMVFKYLRAIMPQVKKVGEDKLLEGLLGIEPVKAETAELSKKLAAYLSDSALAKQMKVSIERLETARTVESWREIPNGVSCDTNECASVVTNVIKNFEKRVVVAKRPQTPDEIEKFGISCGGIVDEKTGEADEEEVVEVTTVTITKTVKRIRRRTTVESSSSARFEKLFLAGGDGENNMSVQTDEGAAAVKEYFAASEMSVKKRKIEAALKRNPGDKQLWNLYGRILGDEGDNMAALICYRNALKLDRFYEYALVNAALICNTLKQFEHSSAYAILALGLSDDKWCREKAEKIVKGENK